MSPDLRQRYAALRASAPVVSGLALLHIGAQQTVVAVGSGPEPETVLVLELGYRRTSAEFFQHTPPTPGEVETAIMRVEDEVTRARAVAVGQPTLFTTDTRVRDLARIAGCPDRPDTPLSVEQVERLFDQLAARAQGRPLSQTDIPDDPEFNATLLILREFMHHLQFSAITVSR
jgi:exopolyphosphatase/pppGpp-phosphohydrolase